MRPRYILSSPAFCLLLFLSSFGLVTCGGGNSGGGVPVTSATYSISGSLSPAVGGAGATVTLSGPVNATTTANGSGLYSFTGLPAGAYTITPSGTVATFSPASQPATISNSSLTNMNFTAATTTSIFFFDNFAGTTLSSDWTVISRHGEYAQSETECNVPQQVVTNNGLSISAAAQNWSCGDFNLDGSVRHAPANWPYITGDVQWRSLNFTYGTVEIRAQFPANATHLWPAFWLLGSNCQQTNPLTADVGYSTCPFLSSSSYAEIDMVECDANNWCQFALSNPGNFPTCGFSVDTNYHTFTLKWNSTIESLAIDGKSTGCSFSSSSMTIPSTPMFLIMQIQTGGFGGTPNNALLPATLAVDYVRVTQP
jgi:beta-glucanase (GH16 family)